ncbi:MAG: sensor histidine kinase [Sphaerochaetaceae bacterium]
MRASRKQRRDPVRKLRHTVIYFSICIVIISVCTFALVEYFVYEVLGSDIVYDPIDAIGMIGPMGVVLGFFSYFSLKKANRYFFMLIDGIHELSEGNFKTRLSVNEAGPFKEVFANFNTMCEELDGVETLREDFVRKFSHELRTPLMSINGFSSLMLEGGITESEQLQYLTIIESESKRLAELAESTLLMTRLEAQQLIVDKEYFALDEQLKECIILLEPQWSKKQLDVSADLPSTVGYGNSELLKQVWINLLSNAIKYTPERGTLTVMLTQEQSSLKVSIQDTGIGIHEEALPKIFNEYYRGVDTGVIKGIGLGLSIAKKIIDLSGGAIHVSSMAGKGSTFTVTLPRPNETKDM